LIYSSVQKRTQIHSIYRTNS